jgi:hypothetical protein
MLHANSPFLLVLLELHESGGSVVNPTWRAQDAAAKRSPSIAAAGNVFRCIARRKQGLDERSGVVSYYIRLPGKMDTHQAKDKVLNQKQST